LCIHSGAASSRLTSKRLLFLLLLLETLWARAYYPPSKLFAYLINVLQPRGFRTILPEDI
jgi:hypothetical protein